MIRVTPEFIADHDGSRWPIKMLICIPFKNAKILIVSLLVSVIPVWLFCLLKEKQAAASDACLLYKCTSSLALFAVSGILAEIFPSHSYLMSPSSEYEPFVLDSHCKITLQPNHWTLVLRLLLLVTQVGNQNQFQSSARNLGHSSCCSVTGWATMLPHTYCISGFISLCKCLRASISAQGKMETVTSSLSFIS